MALAEPGAALCVDDFSGSAIDPASPRSPGLLEEVTEQAIDDALRRAHGNVTSAARLLGMGRATLYRRLKRR